MKTLVLICDRSRHLICLPYTIANLHDMARRLKLSRSWYHSAKYPHYDIPVKRKEEIERMCIVHPARTLVVLMRMVYRPTDRASRRKKRRRSSRSEQTFGIQCICDPYDASRSTHPDCPHHGDLGRF